MLQNDRSMLATVAQCCSCEQRLTNGASDSSGVHTGDRARFHVKGLSTAIATGML